MEIHSSSLWFLNVGCVAAAVLSLAAGGRRICEFPTKHSHRKVTKMITWITASCNSMKLWTIPCRATQDGWVMVESCDKTWSIGEGNGKPHKHSCFKNPMNSIKVKNIWHQKMSLPGQWWASQVSKCPICYWGRAQKKKKKWRGWAKWGRHGCGSVWWWK